MKAIYDSGNIHEYKIQKHIYYTKSVYIVNVLRSENLTVYILSFDFPL